MTNEDKIAILAGGCFWGVQDLFRKQPGVVSTRVGYTGGRNTHATYRNHPGHAEAIEITYDPDETDYRTLLEFFFQIHDPTTKDSQGNDMGTSYRSGFFIWTTSRSRSRWTPSPISTRQGYGPPRWSPRSVRPATFGRPNPSTKIISSATRPGIRVTTSDQTGRCPTAAALASSHLRRRT
ncbi:MAG: peptide-methionine (S)-S-oxide reductase [Mycobacterium sp.]|nr:peptide-methionine (S)-S-oxide reductase [Mycobacterium sp.]